MIKYISKIEYCEAAHVALATPLPDGKHVSITDYIPFEKICSIGLSQVEISDKIENGTRLWNTKLTVVLPERKTFSNNPMAFRVTAVDGSKFLIGLSERPYPVINSSDLYAGKTSEQSACTLTVTWSSIYPMLIIC